MASFWALALVQIITKDLLRGSEKTTLVKIFWVAVAGALTHYYCIVFTVLLCAGYTLIRAIMRQWKPVLGMCVTGGCAALTAYTVFPAMLYHMFGGYRGTESMDNLRAPFGELLIRIRQYVRLLCSQILGGSVLATVILLILIGYVLYCLFRKRETLRSFRALALILCGITAFLFFLFVARSAVYITDRYVMLVYPEILLTVSAVLFLAEKELLHLPHGGGMRCLWDYWQPSLS
ncbi:MAG: hypothetical protein IJQ12_07460 [Lachnospiraceae bacterium]|nr:hypothetical protein [Lachnospiraceae bacterium]